MDDGSLLLADARRQSLLRMSPNGERLTPPAFELPVREIRPILGGFLLKIANDQYLALNRNLRLEKSFRFDSTGTASISAVYNWMPLAKALLAFADVREGGRWTSGWVKIPLANNGRYQMLRPAPLKGLERNLYPLGLPYVAAAGEKGYFLAPVEGEMRLFSVSAADTGNTISELPKGPRYVLPKLAGPAGFGAVAARYKALETFAGPVGLYGYDKKLFLLTRRPSPDGTDWRLHRLDPTTGEELGSGTLPTSAAHLLVIPGPKQWAVIEKDPVRSPGDQEVRSMLVLPAEWAEGLKDSPSGSSAGRSFHGLLEAHAFKTSAPTPKDLSLARLLPPLQLPGG